MSYKHIKYFIFFFAFAMFVQLLGISSVRGAQSSTFDWDKLLKAWENYLNYPSSENADKVSELLPDSGHVKYAGKHWEEVVDTIYKDLYLLELQVYSSDRAAVRLTFKLYTIADGAFGEELGMILGALIRINSRLYLEEAQHNRNLLASMGLGLPTGSMGYWYIENDSAQCLEASLRIKALKNVQDSSLINIRNECIKQLEPDCEGVKK